MDDRTRQSLRLIEWVLVPGLAFAAAWLFKEGHLVPSALVAGGLAYYLVERARER